ncbi:helix-turn-helix transcriptional regulator [Shewanella algae]|uniref:helix-turn-helix transcriptional regulator n=1 Tax=Shewanella algae TaxID=38313 RepID=UPI001AAE8991|nr:AlpA family transcriptional regulator [Shewanella algae]MBO2581740.1 AlpA family transcriptional regulator [Shewanella algae]
MRLIKLKEVLNLTALSRASVYRMMADGKFPSSVSLGERSVGWVEEEILNWIEERIAARDDGQNTSSLAA